MMVAKETMSDLIEHDRVSTRMSPEDFEALRRAVQALERPSLAARLSSVLGKPIEVLGQALPPVLSQTIARATDSALMAALKVALSTLPNGPSSASNRLHTFLAAASGAVGGALGLSTAALELPVSTTIMLRAIAEIARQEGEDLSDPEAALSCVQVFALGGRSSSDDAAESGYFAVRAALAKSVTEAARYMAERGFLEKGAPALVRFAAQVAARFGIVVSQKIAAQAVPVLGAIGGAAVNAAFMDHFQSLAHGHFTVRRLERAYGREAVRAAYEELRRPPEA